MTVYHAMISAAPDYQQRRAPHRQAHLERLLELRARGLVIGGGPAPDGQTAELFYRVRQPDQITPLLEEDPYYAHGVWTGYRLRSFGQVVEPWGSPPVVTDGSRTATLAEGVAAEPEMATFALIELRGAGRLAFGGFFEGGQTLGLFRTADPDEARRWLQETGFWKPESLSARPLLWVL
ncbi:MAG: YciI family protein [Candidatus Methylomirabilia bacterium]